MTEPDWGVGEPAASFPEDRWIRDPVLSDRVEDVPEVAAARAQGFHPAPDDPLWCFVPAVWPVEARAWVRDCRVRHLSRRYGDGRSERLPWTAADYAELEHDTNAALAELGLPPRPAGRIWLLRAPAPYATAQDLMEDVWARWRTTGAPATATRDLVDATRRRLREVF